MNSILMKTVTRKRYIIHPNESVSGDETQAALIWFRLLLMFFAICLLKQLNVMKI